LQSDFKRSNLARSITNRGIIVKDVWDAHLNDEVGYWQSMIAGTFHNKDWVAGFRRRAAGIDIAPLHLHEFLTSGQRVLDVGSGPATVLGGVLNGTPINITAVDPLANQYMELYSAHEITPLVKPIYGEGERLSQIVSGKYDFVYSRNALDHSYDPMKAIQEMIEVCADGGVVFFENVVNEGYNENYKGLHQWNFMHASGDLVIWKHDGSAWLASRELRGFKALNAFVIRDGWVAVKISV
jgi:SAM-dependent methyltransferase